MVMNRLFRKLAGTLAALVILSGLSSCGTPNYKGYKYSAYTIRGQRYYPIPPNQAVGFEHRGGASWYDERGFFTSGTTAIGDKFRAGSMAGAHKTLPLPCRVKVTNLRNGKTAIIRINDRGPFIAGRVLDVTPAAAKKLGFKKQGITDVHLKVISVGDGKYKITRRR